MGKNSSNYTIDVWQGISNSLLWTYNSIQWARTPATVLQMFGRGSVAASFGLVMVSNGQKLQQLYRRCLAEISSSLLCTYNSIQWVRTPATIPQMFDRGSVAASFVLIIVSNGQELQQLYHRCVANDQ